MKLSFEWDEEKANSNIRIISCRKATSTERELYDEGDD